MGEAVGEAVGSNVSIGLGAEIVQHSFTAFATIVVMLVSSLELLDELDIFKVSKKKRNGREFKHLDCETFLGR